MAPALTFLFLAVHQLPCNLSAPSTQVRVRFQAERCIHSSRQARKMPMDTRAPPQHASRAASPTRKIFVITPAADLTDAIFLLRTRESCDSHSRTKAGSRAAIAHPRGVVDLKATSTQRETAPPIRGRKQEPGRGRGDETFRARGVLHLRNQTQPIREGRFPTTPHSTVSGHNTAARRVSMSVCMCHYPRGDGAAGLAASVSQAPLRCVPSRAGPARNEHTLSALVQQRG